MIDSANNRMITSVAMLTAQTNNGNMYGTQCVMNTIEQQLFLLFDDVIDASSADMETLVIAYVYFDIQPTYRCTFACFVDVQDERSMCGQVLFVVFVFEVV